MGAAGGSRGQRLGRQQGTAPEQRPSRRQARPLTACACAKPYTLDPHRLRGGHAREEEDPSQQAQQERQHDDRPVESHLAGLLLLLPGGERRRVGRRWGCADGRGSHARWRLWKAQNLPFSFDCCLLAAAVAAIRGHHLLDELWWCQHTSDCPEAVQLKAARQVGVGPGKRKAHNCGKLPRCHLEERSCGAPPPSSCWAAMPLLAPCHPRVGCSHNTGHGAAGASQQAGRPGPPPQGPNQPASGTTPLALILPAADLAAQPATLLPGCHRRTEPTAPSATPGHPAMPSTRAIQRAPQWGRKECCYTAIVSAGRTRPEGPRRGRGPRGLLAHWPSTCAAAFERSAASFFLAS